MQVTQNKSGRNDLGLWVEDRTYETNGVVKSIRQTEESFHRNGFMPQANYKRTVSYLTIQTSEGNEEVMFPQSISELEIAVLINQNARWKEKYHSIEVGADFGETKEYELALLSGALAGKKLTAKLTH